MAATEVFTSGNNPDPGDAEFAGIRADLARLFIAHKAGMGMAAYPDAWIIEHVTDVTAVLWTLSQHALDHNDWGWLTRHYWWLQAATRLHHGEDATTLDG